MTSEGIAVLQSLADEAELNEDAEKAILIYRDLQRAMEMLPSSTENQCSEKRSFIVSISMKAAACALRFNRYDEADASLRVALSIDIKNRDALRVLGCLLLTRNVNDQAEIFLRAFVEEECRQSVDTEDGAKLGDGMCTAGRMGSSRKLQSVALLYLLHERNSKAQNGSGRFKHREWPRLSRGGGPLQSAALTATADRLLNLGFIDLAETALELAAQAVAGNQTRAAAVRQRTVEGRLFLLCDDLERSEEQLREAIELAEPGTSDSRNVCELLGHTLFLSGKFDEARACYESALFKRASEIVPALLYLRLGNIYLHEKCYNEAKEVFLRACRPSGEGGQPSATMWLGVGISCIRSDDLEHANEALVEANFLDNTNVQVLGHIALLCMQWKPCRAHEADAALEQALCLGLGQSAGDAGILLEIGQAYLEAKKVRMAEKALRASIRANPKSGITYMRLAEALEGQHRETEALEAYIKARQCNLGAEEVRDATVAEIKLRNFLGLAEKSVAEK
jgi:tetratricopeptide (TPR) repeat protein